MSSERASRVWVVVVITLAACGGAGDPGGGDDGGGDDGSCVPDEQFCSGDEVRTCTASGMDSVRESQCLPLPVAQLCVDCGPEAAYRFGCDADQPAIDGNGSLGTGAMRWDVAYRVPGGCDMPLIQAPATVDDGAFHHSAYLGSNQYLTFTLRQTGTYDGPLWEHVDPQVSRVLVTAFPPWPGGVSCLSANAGPISPPGAGHVHVELGGTAVGDPFAITITGYLWCVIGSDIQWYPIDLATTGVLY